MCGKYAGRLGQFFDEAKLSLYISRPLKRLGYLLSLKRTKEFIRKSRYSADQGSKMEQEHLCPCDRSVV